MSKLSFRARALDAAKPLPIYRGKDMPDLNDCVSINRAVPQMPTGMEKEEESVGTRVFITPPPLLPLPFVSRASPFTERSTLAGGRRCRCALWTLRQRSSVNLSAGAAPARGRHVVASQCCD